MNKKAQVDVKELGITLVVAALLFIIGLLIFAKVSNITETILDPTPVGITNETHTITMMGVPPASNATLLDKLGFITGTDLVINSTAAVLVRDTDYTIALKGPSGSLATIANFTLVNTIYNGSELSISYTHNIQSASQASTAVVQSTVLDSFELGVIALIVLAAVVILGVLFMLGSQ